MTTEQPLHAMEQIVCAECGTTAHQPCLDRAHPTTPPRRYRAPEHPRH